MLAKNLQKMEKSNKIQKSAQEQKKQSYEGTTYASVIQCNGWK